MRVGEPHPATFTPRKVLDQPSSWTIGSDWSDQKVARPRRPVGRRDSEVVRDLLPSRGPFRRRKLDDALPGRRAEVLGVRSLNHFVRRRAGHGELRGRGGAEGKDRGLDGGEGRRGRQRAADSELRRWCESKACLQQPIQRCRVTGRVTGAKSGRGRGSPTTLRRMPSLVLQESAVGAPGNGSHSVAAALVDHKPVLVRSLPLPPRTRCRN